MPLNCCSLQYELGFELATFSYSVGTFENHFGAKKVAKKLFTLFIYFIGMTSAIPTDFATVRSVLTPDTCMVRLLDCVDFTMPLCD